MMLSAYSLTVIFKICCLFESVPSSFSLLSKCNQKCLEKWSFIFITWSFSARRLAPSCGQWQHKTSLTYWMLLMSGPFSAHRGGELYHSGIHSGSAASTLRLISGSAKGQQKSSVSQTLLGKPKLALATVPLLLLLLYHLQSQSIFLQIRTALCFFLAKRSRITISNSGF